MAVDKSFVVKNGLEVNSDLIVADSNTKKVGIASTGPRSTLDVRGGIAATDINITGVATIATIEVAAGDVNIGNLNVSGFSTFGGVTVDQLTVSGVATFADLSYDEITGRNINITGIATIPVFVGLTSFNDGVEVTGISTITSLDNTDVNVSGTATIATANITTISNTPTFNGGANFSGVVTASQFVGGAGQIGIGTTGDGSAGIHPVGFGVSFLEFRGPGFTTAQYNAAVGIVTLSFQGGGGGSGSASIGVGSTPGDAFTGVAITAGNLWYNTGLGRLFIYYQDDNSAQWVDAAPFNVGIITQLNNVAFATGTVAAPALTFGQESDRGLFAPATGELAYSSGGVGIVTFNSTGVLATTYFGDGSNLTGIDATSLKDDGGNVKAQANPNGVVITGILTGSTANYTGVVTASGGFIGDLTGDVVGDLTGDVNAPTFDTGVGGVVVTGVITATSGLDAIGIQSGGIDITTGVVTAINFTGVGNTVTYDSTTKVVSVSVGSGSGLSTTGVTGIQTAAFFSNPSMVHESITLDEGNNNYGVFGPLGVAIGATITVGTANTFTIA